MLARNVSWAALRARGYAEGEYTLRKYAVYGQMLSDYDLIGSEAAHSGVFALQGGDLHALDGDATPLD